MAIESKFELVELDPGEFGLRLVLSNEAFVKYPGLEAVLLEILPKAWDIFGEPILRLAHKDGVQISWRLKPIPLSECEV